MTTPPVKRVLIADDSADDREMVARAMPAAFVVREAATVAEAAALLETEDFFVALVDVFLQADDQRASGIALGESMAQRIPVIYMSAKEDRTQQALKAARIDRLEFLDKNKDFGDREHLARRLDDIAGSFYSPIEISFSERSLSWGAIVDKLGFDADQRASAEFELQLLVRRAVNGWDESASDAVRATRLELAHIAGSSDHTMVLQMLPYSANGDAQADAVLKISRASRTPPGAQHTERNEHTQFNRYKNVIGGYGLRERRHSRRCRYQAQVFAVPYYRLKDTLTYADFFEGEADDPAGLQRVEAVTRYVFDRALEPLNRRMLTGDRDLSLADYYAKRIDAERRLAMIRRDLTAARRPSSLLVSAATITTHARMGMRELPNPVDAVLEQRAYACVGERVSTQLRHGDFHTGNVLVDRVHGCAWFLDYEMMDESHFHMVDHVEFESDVLFSLLKLDDNFELMVALVDAITGPGLSDAGPIEHGHISAAHEASVQKAMAAVKAIRACARRALPPGSVRPYYHALMFEALRVAGKPSLPSAQRWRALVAAAVIFDKLESDYAND